MSDKRKHTPVRTEGGWWCSVCLKSWKSKPRSVCHGAVKYTWWDKAPGHLMTKTQLSKEGLKPGFLHRAYMDTTNYKGGFYKLFDVNEAVPKRKVSAAQKEVLERARVKADEQRRTCPSCKGLVAHAHELYGVGICDACAEAEFKAMLEADRAEAVQWARQILECDLVILDLETTTLHNAEIVQIGVLSKTSEVLVEQLVKPARSISAAATQVHGITDEDVADASPFTEIADQLLGLLEGKTVAVYNLEFDRGVLRNELGRVYRERQGLAHFNAGSDRLYGPFDYFSLPGEHDDKQRHFVQAWLETASWKDVMEPYAAFVGQWHNYWGNYTWQPLHGDHQAIDDCRACLELLQRMAAYALPDEASQGVTMSQIVATK